MKKIKKTCKGFTLAEVLITLMIIGIIASLTIPALMQNTHKQEYVTALQKEYSAISQAYNLLLSENGGDATSLVTGITHADDANFMNTLATKLKVSKNCGTGMGCWYTTHLNWLDGTQYAANVDSTRSGQYGKAILADGSMTLIDIWNASCLGTAGSSSLKICGNIQIDVNGAKGPNTLGRDYFVFRITQTGIYPIGTIDDGYTCDASTATSTANFGCAGKVLLERAMNY